MTGNGSYRERRLTAQDGLSLYYRDYGDPLATATPVLCLTGLTRNSKDYHDLATRLCAGRRVICPDYRGRGQSQYDSDWRHYSPTVYVNDIKHLLMSLNVHSVIVVGTSLGAFLAMGLAVAIPAAVAGAVLNDAGPDVDPGGLARILDYIGTDRPQTDWSAATATVKELFPSLSISTEDGWAQMARNTFREGDDGLLHFDWDVNLAKPMQKGLALPDLWALFRALRHVPVLSLRGEISDVLSPETFERMAEDMPKLTRVTVPGVGHAPMLDEPVVVAALDEFFAGTG